MALEMGQRPTAMLFRDHFYGFRDQATGDATLPASDIHWNSWDYALADAITFMQDHTDSHGHLLWEVDDDERVELILERKIDRHAAAEENATKGTAKKPYKGQPGERWVSRLRLYPWVEKQGGTWPTVAEWYEAENKRLGITPENP